MGIKLGKARRFIGTFLDDAKNPAPVDETNQEVSAITTNGAIENFEKVLDADGKVTGATGRVRPSQLGPVQVQITADADRGDGVRTLTLVGEEVCIAGEATGGTINLDGVDED